MTLPKGISSKTVQRCFNESSVFPISYRLYDKEECERYFEIVNSEQYKKDKEESEVQFVLKVGFGVHRGVGVYLVDNEVESNLIANYTNGKKCGEIDENLVT